MAIERLSRATRHGRLDRGSTAERDTVALADRLARLLAPDMRARRRSDVRDGSAARAKVLVETIQERRASGGPSNRRD